MVLEYPGIEALFETLLAEKYRLLGPTVRDGAVVIDEIFSGADLPRGWTSSQEAGSYRLVRRSDEALFGFPVGPGSWKSFLLPPRVRLARSRRSEKGFEPEPDADPEVKTAWIGVRACDLAARAILDRVLLEGEYVDPAYARTRAGVFTVAVHCTEPAGTCFCASMGTGPRVSGGFDLALTEITDGGRPIYLLETGSERGAELASRLPARKSEEAERETARARVDAAGSRMGRQLELTGLKEILYRNYENPRWEQVASRCLACTNCTAVCPTCFCHTVEDVTALHGETAERWRRWDSCFTAEFSFIHGGSVRRSVRSRYRQWLLHKLATWQDQFGTPGCVGCGRCITWCPAAIDITEEAAVIRETDPVAAAERRAKP
jgi:ferredoxin